VVILVSKDRIVFLNVGLKDYQWDWLEELRRRNGDRSISETLRKIIDQQMEEKEGTKGG